MNSSSSLRRWRTLLVAVAAALLALSVSPASADGPEADLDCVIVSTQDIHPPITPEPGPITSTTHGQTGTADCTGTIDGAQVTGPGTFGSTNTAFGNCSGIDGTGRFVMQFPTTEGLKTITGMWNFNSGALPGEVILSGDVTGTVNALAVEGDCVNTPITSSTTRLDVHIST